MQTTFAGGPRAKASDERTWLVQRLSWGAGLVILIAALAGVLGGGWTSRREAVSDDGRIHVEYDRFCRSGMPVRFTIRADQLAGDSELVIRLPPPFLEHFQIRGSSPPARRARTGPDGVAMTFETSGPSATVRLDCEVGDAGRARSVIRFGPGDGESAVTLDQFIYP